MQTHNTQLTQSLRHTNQYKNIPDYLPTKLILIVRSYWYQRTLYFLNLFLQNIFNNKQSQAQGIFLVECLVVHEASSVTRKKSPNVAQKWFHEKYDSFWHLYKNCLRMWEIWAK